MKKPAKFNLKKQMLLHERGPNLWSLYLTEKHRVAIQDALGPIIRKAKGLDAQKLLTRLWVTLATPEELDTINKIADEYSIKPIQKIKGN